MIRNSWRKARIALQLMAEEKVGAPMRAKERAELEAEDKAFEMARKKLPNAG